MRTIKTQNGTYIINDQEVIVITKNGVSKIYLSEAPHISDDNDEMCNELMFKILTKTVSVTKC